MEADKTKEFISYLEPFIKPRYSVTHREVQNLIYHLTVFDSDRFQEKEFSEFHPFGTQIRKCFPESRLVVDDLLLITCN